MDVAYVMLDGDAAEPRYAHEGDAGMDLRTLDGCRLRPLERKVLRTGVAMQIPEGYWGAVVPRSGLAIKEGLTVLNAPGCIDSSYRGEIGVCVVNLSTSVIEIRPGERVAQLVVLPHATCELVLTSSLDGTERGAGGWGSTGTE